MTTEASDKKYEKQISEAGSSSGRAASTSAREAYNPANVVPTGDGADNTATYLPAVNLTGGTTDGVTSGSNLDSNLAGQVTNQNLPPEMQQLFNSLNTQVSQLSSEVSLLTQVVQLDQEVSQLNTAVSQLHSELLGQSTGSGDAVSSSNANGLNGNNGELPTTGETNSSTGTGSDTATTTSANASPGAAGDTATTTSANASPGAGSDTVIAASADPKPSAGSDTVITASADPNPNAGSDTAVTPTAGTNDSATTTDSANGTTSSGTTSNSTTGNSTVSANNADSTSSGDATNSTNATSTSDTSLSPSLQQAVSSLGLQTVYNATGDQLVGYGGESAPADPLSDYGTANADGSFTITNDPTNWGGDLTPSMAVTGTQLDIATVQYNPNEIIQPTWEGGTGTSWPTVWGNTEALANGNHVELDTMEQFSPTEPHSGDINWDSSLPGGKTSGPGQFIDVNSFNSNQPTQIAELINTQNDTDTAYINGQEVYSDTWDPNSSWNQLATQPFNFILGTGNGEPFTVDSVQILAPSSNSGTT